MVCSWDLIIGDHSKNIIRISHRDHSKTTIKTKVIIRVSHTVARRTNSTASTKRYVHVVYLLGYRTVKLGLSLFVFSESSEVRFK